ncbi:hypothetical protein [Achromobacter xylosoxidans]|uniref:hypothetical protein n=1 Tax=Alcaligenes xylosoxydans xylosoxydans TaxID=85698 RepID=UPI000A6F8515|nr:hypothetical protein [Achromobacter xylosoxidans]
MAGHKSHGFPRKSHGLKYLLWGRAFSFPALISFSLLKIKEIEIERDAGKEKD